MRIKSAKTEVICTIPTIVQSFALKTVHKPISPGRSCLDKFHGKQMILSSLLATGVSFEIKLPVLLGFHLRWPSQYLCKIIYILIFSESKDVSRPFEIFYASILAMVYVKAATWIPC